MLLLKENFIWIIFWIEVIDIVSNKFVQNHIYFIICVSSLQVITYYDKLKLCLLGSMWLYSYKLWDETQDFILLVVFTISVLKLFIVTLELF